MQATTSSHRNRLADETSPYLQQHAANPVDWYPWGEAALNKARSEGKPILLSIGYSACHWCHVMAHESFESESTAALMNELFVNIKVDREERPDIDRIYQIAHQMLTQRGGGWPLTMFLSPEDQRPFFGGTYFPDRPRYGMPAFAEILQRVAQYHREHGAEIRQQNTQLLAAFDELVPPAPAATLTLTDEPLKAARAQLERQFDKRHGGFGGAPKFPHPTTIDRLLRDWQRTAHQLEPDLQALYMAALTLQRMAEGGLNDQLGGGFARYSVDEVWMIPHFEKMLYDNGALLGCYADAARATGEALFAATTSSTAAWLRREMQAPEGGYYSSFDADSEGHEGRYYVWDRAAVRALLSADEWAVFAPRFGLDCDANFEGSAWHLHGTRSLQDVATVAGVDLTTAQQRIDSARAQLLQVRARRIPPGRDDKILTSWNALAIRGMALAARASRDASECETCIGSAARALEFVHTALWREGRLLATYKGGKAHLSAYLDDYAYLLDAILTLLQCRWQSAWLSFAVELAEVLLARFSDPVAGGFYFTADDHEALIHRSKSFSDDATPSGNAIAAFALQRLGFLLGEERYLQAAENTLRAGWEPLNRAPYAHTSLLTALDEYLSPPQIIILRGVESSIGHWQQQLDRLYAPRRLVFAIASDAPDLPSTLADKSPRGAAVAYVCEGRMCSEPFDELARLAQHLRLGLDH
jgi:hypothetical protein